MTPMETRSLRGRSRSNTRFALDLLATTALGGTLAFADEITSSAPGHLLLSRSVYDAPANIIAAGVTQLPPGCTPGNCVTATADGTYPTVFNNAIVDAPFGVTAPILIDEMLPIPSGDVVQTIQ